MITVQELTLTELEQQKDIKLPINDRQPAYTDLWITPNGEILKLFSGNADTFCHEEIQSDINTIMSLAQGTSFFEPRFIIPSRVLTIEGKVIGYIMPYSRFQPLKEFVFQTGQHFKKIMLAVQSDIDFLNRKTSYSFCDFHEDNILVGESDTIIHIDADGWYCGDLRRRRSRYISLSQKRLAAFPDKYDMDDKGYIIGNMNSDLFCFFFTMINLVMHSTIRFELLSEKEQLKYLGFLADRLNSDEFTTMYLRLFSKDDNSITLDGIHFPPDITVLSYDTFIRISSTFKSEQEALLFLLEQEKHLDSIVDERRFNIEGLDTH